MSETAGQADPRGEERTYHAERDPVDQQTPAYEPHRFEIGAFEATVISDGVTSVPNGIVAVTPPQREFDRALREVGIGDQAPLDANVLAVDTGDELVLVDAGAGAAVPFPGGGRLLEGLAAVGIGSGDVDAVVITHAHPGHVGGLLDGNGNAAFPGARYLLSRRDWEFWSASASPPGIWSSGGGRQRSRSSTPPSTSPVPAPSR